MRRVLESGRYILDREGERFEAAFARYLGVPHVIGTGSGTAALELALRALDVGRGDEVVVPALTAPATAMAVAAVGARPVFADIDPATYTLAPAALERAFTKRTRAVIPVHLYGQCADMTAIGRLATSAGIPVIEDAAQAHGARYRGRRAGTIGRLACFSFYPTKNLGAYGDAGAVATREAALAARLRRLRSYGQSGAFAFSEPGLNGRLDELQAAILRLKLRGLERGNARRRAHAAHYRRGIRSPRIALPVEAAGRHHVYHQFVVRTAARDRLRTHLAARGIATLIHYPRALHELQAFEGCGRVTEPLREATRAAAEVLSLPIYPELPLAVLRAVIAAVNAFV